MLVQMKTAGSMGTETGVPCDVSRDEAGVRGKHACAALRGDLSKTCGKIFSTPADSYSAHAFHIGAR